MRVAITAAASFGMSDFKKLRVWRKAHALTLNIHRLTATIRGSKHATLRSQMNRAAMSISANIVEGRAYGNERDFVRFLGYSLASTSELEYHLIVARDIRAITDSDFSSTLGQLIDVRKMLHGLIGKLKKTRSSPSKTLVPSLAADSGQQTAAGGQQRT
jgi:four helix bundle protein